MGLALALACGGDDDEVDAGVDVGGDDSGEADVAPDTNFDAGPGECFTENHPDPTTGSCAAEIVDPNATLPVGDDGAGGYIVPGANRVTRLGTQVELPGFPIALRPVPSTDYVIVTDGGVDDERLSVVDVSTGTVVDQRDFRERPDEALFIGIAIASDGSKVYVSGGGSNLLWIYDFDTSTGQLSNDRSISFAPTPNEGYISGMQLLSDDTTLVLTLLQGSQVVVFDTETDSEIRRIATPENTRAYDVVVLPDDQTAFVSLWNDSSVLPLDLDAGTAATPIPVGKNPAGLALSPDATTLVVADSDSDSLSVIDVGTETRTDQIWIESESALRGASPAAGRFNATGTRFFSVNAGDNAIDVFDVADWSRVGRIPTMWYPTDVALLDDGRVLSLCGKHEGTGANLDPGEAGITERVGGSLSIIAAEDITDEELARYEVEVAANNDRAASFQSVECAGADYDFPVPMPGMGASDQIRHVILVVRENKTYDAYFGDLMKDGVPHGNGDPDLTLIPRDDIEQVIPNTRELAREFSMGDNYYSLAEQSVQGHIRTTMGRSTDYIERSWLTTWGRGYYGIPTQGLAEVGYPEEGSAFDYFTRLDISVNNYGEIVSSRAAAPNARYPGLVYNMGFTDQSKAEFMRTEWHVGCELASFTYILIPNDHTYGGSAGRPTPASMMADNDFAVGILVDALSHSTFWPESVMFVIEDDPQNGGDHVDNHRSPLLVVSPWARRGYVSSVHYNESSIFQTIAQIFGVDSLNRAWAQASPMYDMFSSTPDYTPYEALERVWPEAENPPRGIHAAESEGWDFSVPDEQPGLGRQLWRMLRGSEPPWHPREEILEILEEEAEESDADSDADSDEH